MGCSCDLIIVCSNRCAITNTAIACPLVYYRQLVYATKSFLQYLHTSVAAYLNVLGGGVGLLLSNELGCADTENWPNEISQMCCHSNKVGLCAEIQPRLFPADSYTRVKAKAGRCGAFGSISPLRSNNTMFLDQIM